MRIISAAEVEAALNWDSLIERLRQGFRRGGSVPPKQRFCLDQTLGETVGSSGDRDSHARGQAAQRNKWQEPSLTIMPAWQSDRLIGIHLATLFPDNAARRLPAAMGTFLLLDGRTGVPLALIDGPTLTAKRTAAVSALASSYLSRPDCERLLMVGCGRLAPHLIVAHAAVRPICNVLIWNRTPEKAVRLAKRMTRRNFRVEATEDLEGAARGAHVICCATTSLQPLVRGDWLAPGQHLDLVGAHRPDMRESDDATVRRARIFVDTREGALSEAGDIVQAVDSGALDPADIAGDLFDLARGDRAGRRFYDQITLFKSVGTAFQDLVAAQLAVERT